MSRMAWMEFALCRDMPTAVFFPEGNDGGTDIPAEAAAACRECPVRQPCLEYALSTPATFDKGVWGGTSERQRIRMRQARKRAS